MRLIFRDMTGIVARPLSSWFSVTSLRGTSSTQNRTNLAPVEGLTSQTANRPSTSSNCSEDSNDLTSTLLHSHVGLESQRSSFLYHAPSLLLGFG